MPYIWSLFLDGYPLHCSGIWQNLWLSMDTKQACVMIRLDCVVKTWSTFKFNHYHHDREDLCVAHLKRETNQFSLWPLTTFLMTLNFDRNDNLRKSPSPNRVTQSGFHRWSGRFLGITTGWDPSVCKSNRLHVDRHPPVSLHQIKAYSIDSFQKIGNFPAVSNFNRFFLKLNQFICNQPPVLPDHWISPVHGSCGVGSGHKCNQPTDRILCRSWLLLLLAHLHEKADGQWRWLASHGPIMVTLLHDRMHMTATSEKTKQNQTKQTSKHKIT